MHIGKMNFDFLSKKEHRKQVYTERGRIMDEFRCKFCHRLLAKVEDAGLVEIKCPKCKTMNLHCRDRAMINMAIVSKTQNNTIVGESYVEAIVPENFKH